VIVNEQVLDGSIEAFAVGVHFRVFRVGEVVSNLVRAEGFVEVFEELGTVVGEDGELAGVRVFGEEAGEECVEGKRCILARLGWRGERKSDA